MQTSNVTYPDLTTFLAFLATAPPVPEMTTLDVFHDCNRIAWYWAAILNGSTSGKKEERGVSLLYTIECGMADLSDGVVNLVGTVVGKEDAYGGRKVNMLMWEFDSLGWGEAGGR